MYNLAEERDSWWITQLLSIIKYQTTLLKITCLYFVTSELSTEVVWRSIKILFICPTKDPFICARNIKVQRWNLREQRQPAIVEFQAYTRALDWSPGLVATQPCHVIWPNSSGSSLLQAKPTSWLPCRVATFEGRGILGFTTAGIDKLNI